MRNLRLNYETFSVEVWGYGFKVGIKPSLGSIIVFLCGLYYFKAVGGFSNEQKTDL